MRKVKFEYSLVVFLYAYLIQIDLSLDRSRWMPIDDLRDFYKSQISPKQVSDYLVANLQLNVKRLNLLIFIGNSSFWTRIKDMLWSRFRKDILLEEDQLIYLCQKLSLLNKILEADEPVHPLETERLRVEFSKLTFGTIQYKLTGKDRLKAQKVEHFLQNEILSTCNIREFSKDYF